MIRSALIALAAALALSGCGWRAGLPNPEGATTLGVAFPGNETRLRDLELEVGLALAEVALERLTLSPAAPSDADLVLRGRILDYRGRGGIRSDGNVLLEAGTEIRVAMELHDRRSGHVLATAERSLEGGFLVDAFTSPFRASDSVPARDRIVRNLAEGLVLDLFAPPSYEEASSATAADDELDPEAAGADSSAAAASPADGG